MASAVTAREGGDALARMPYLPQLDGVRAVAVLIVFVSHVGFGHLVPGGFGVTVFFFLSGYLITTLLRIERANTGGVNLPGFYMRRSLRILPPMYLTLLFAGALHAIGLLVTPINAAGVIGQAIFLTNYPGLFETVQALPVPLWSLAIEEHFYLAFPLAYSLWLGRMAPRRAALVCLGLCGLVLAIRIAAVLRLEDYASGFHWPYPPVELNYFTTHTRVDAILFGCCLALWNNPVLEGATAWRPKTWHVVAACALILGSLVVRDEAFRQTLRYTVQSAALFVPFAAILHWRGPRLGLLASAPMRRLGLYSYSIYLVHLPIIIALQNAAPELGRLGIMAVAFCLTLAYAALMYAAVERPCARLRRRQHRPDDGPATQDRTQIPDGTVGSPVRSVPAGT